MSRTQYRSLHHRLHGFQEAKAQVAWMAFLWVRGMPLDQVRKILRKRGIHIWSLLPFIRPEDRASIVGRLGLPGWAAETFLDPRWETWGDRTAYFRVPRGCCLPEGLVLESVDLSQSPHLRRLPRRMWTETVSIGDCALLEYVSGFVSRPHSLAITKCPRLRRLNPRAGPVHALSLDSCEALQQVPRLPAHRSSSRWTHVTLHNLVRLGHISQGGVVNLLRVTGCPRLTGLSGFKIITMLELHRCEALCTLPQFQGAVSGHITDCPSLLEEDLCRAQAGQGSTLKVEPMRGLCSLAPVQPVPTLQQVEAQPLFADAAFEEDQAWPWPPVPRAADNEDIERTLRALGLSPLERAHCLIRPDGHLGDAIGAVLSRTETPGKALRVLRSFLEEALSQEDARVVQVLIQQAGAFGIGMMSLWMVLDQGRRQALLPLLPPWWALRLAEVANLEDLCEVLHGIPGPLVLDGPIDTIGQHLGPRSLEGPLWVEGHLNLEDCTELESLPDLMVVTGDLTISSCPALRKFPKRLEVGYGLWIRDLPRLERSICRAKVGEEVTIVRAPALKLVPLGSWDA